MIFIQAVYCYDLQYTGVVASIYWPFERQYVFVWWYFTFRVKYCC